MKDSFLTKIAAHSTITIFRHQHPDGDAFGAQCGLASWLRDNYPEKTVYLLGENEALFDFYFPMDQAADREIEASLAIVVDSATRNRIDDQRYQLARDLIKIDHHPVVDDYGSLAIVDISRSSTCEILADLFSSIDENSVSPKTAQLLLSGILTDSIRFLVEATSAQTLRSAAYLIDRKADLSALNRTIFTRSKTSFEMGLKLGAHVRYDHGVATLIIDNALRHQYNLSQREAKSYNGIMNGITEFQIWAIFVQGDDQRYIGSIRSKQKPINQICERYNGGGHRLACGVNDLSLDRVHNLIAELIETSLT